MVSPVPAGSAWEELSSCEAAELELDGALEEEDGALLSEEGVEQALSARLAAQARQASRAMDFLLEFL